MRSTKRERAEIRHLAERKQSHHMVTVSPSALLSILDDLADLEAESKGWEEQWEIACDHAERLTKDANERIDAMEAERTGTTWIL